MFKSLACWLMMASLSLGCGRPAPPSRALTLHQTWSLSVGTKIAGYTITSGLGDISLNLEGDVVRMPFDGTVESTQSDCVVVATGDIPAYLLRLCGLSHPQLGKRSRGQTIGRASHLAFAMLRREPDGTWAMVEPSPQFIEQFLEHTPAHSLPHP